MGDMKEIYYYLQTHKMWWALPIIIGLCLIAFFILLTYTEIGQHQKYSIF